MPKFLEQNPIYFLRGSAEISPKGVAKLKEWTTAWGTGGAAPAARGAGGAAPAARGAGGAAPAAWGARGLAYFLSVPQNQLQMQKLTADRLAALQAELHRLGVPRVELRYDEKGSVGPFDVVYIGVEGQVR
jgi:hypothetical protein